MSKYNLQGIQFIAYHCNNCYSDKYKHTNGIVPFKSGSITGYSLRENKTLFIFITGTNEFRDMLTDVKLIPSHFDGAQKNIKVHRGFESAYKRIEDIILSRSLCEERVVIAGHSMGGAIATLACYKMAKIIPDITCVTFGSPRVGNRAFAKRFNELVTDSYRLVYKDDAVTKWPKLFSWYRHVGKLYQSKGKSWFPLFFIRAKSHPMQKYINGLKNNMWRALHD